MRRASAAVQQGLTLLGALVIIALAGVAGYYVYHGTFFEPEEPSCDQLFTRCQRKCRRTSTESSEAQACQQACQRELAACNEPAGR